MRILVVSDSHGNAAALRDVLIRFSDRADIIIHLGDGEAEYKNLIEPMNIPTYFVRGNCDFGSVAKDFQIIEVEGRRIFFTHGYRYSVKSGLSVLKSAARSHNADIALYGHTHIAFSEYEDGLYTINPGCLSWRGDGPSCALIDIVKEGILPNIVHI